MPVCLVFFSLAQLSLSWSMCVHNSLIKRIFLCNDQVYLKDEGWSKFFVRVKIEPKHSSLAREREKNRILMQFFFSCQLKRSQESPVSSSKTQTTTTTFVCTLLLHTSSREEIFFRKELQSIPLFSINERNLRLCSKQMLVMVEKRERIFFFEFNCFV